MAGNVRRLSELGMATSLAQELVSQLQDLPWLVTDNFQTEAALAAAKTGNDYFVPTYGAVDLGSGVFPLSGGLTLTRPVTFSGSGWHSTNVYLTAGNTDKSVIRVNVAPLTDPQPEADVGQGLIRDLAIGGNGSAQLGTSHGLEYPAAAWGLDTRYSVSGMAQNVMIHVARSNGLFLGFNRNFGFFNQMIIRYSGDEGALVNCYDTNFNQVQVGNNGLNGTASKGFGFNLVGGGGHFFTSCSTFFNTEGGLAINELVNSSVSWLGGTFDANGTVGASIDGNNNSNVSHIIMGARFSGNARLDSTKSDVFITRMPTPAVLIGNVHLYDQQHKPRFLVELAADTDFAYAVGLSYSTDSYSLGVTNRPYNLILAGNKVARWTHGTSAADTLTACIGTTVKIDITAAGVGFNGQPGIAKPVVTGSRASGDALASLLTALANLGLITDSSTA